MQGWRGFTVAALAFIFGLGLACGGKTNGGGGNGGASSGSSAGGGSSGGGGTSACDDYLDALYGSCGSVRTLPATESTRFKGRFETLCEAALALPGVSLTASSLETCVSALKSGGCSILEQSSNPCSFSSGTLPSGSTCFTDAQCQTGDCRAGNDAADGGRVSCGSCVAPVALGQPCGSGGDLHCGPTASCSESGATGPTCVAITRGGAGAACNGSSTQCNEGLYCGYTTQTCAAPGGAGAACDDDLACVPPFVCAATSGPSTCKMPGAAGASCNNDQDCASGLGCASETCTTETCATGTCATVAYVAAGAACSATMRCLVGSCPLAGTGAMRTCPTVIPDGQPCDESSTTSTCDTFASCEGGKCILGYPTCP